MKVLKLKLDANGHVVVEDGKPVYVYEDGKEAPFDANAAMLKIGELNEEAKTHRLAAKEASEKLMVYKAEDGNLLDPDVAKKAIQTVQNYSDKEMFDATQVESIKTQMNKAYAEKISDLQRSHKAEVDALGGNMSKKDAAIFNLLVKDRFNTSKFVMDKLVIPNEIAADYFGHHFKVEQGDGDSLKVVGYINNEKILSREKPGHDAGFEEAIETIVDNYQLKDRIIKGSGTGSGSFGNSSGSGGQGRAAMLSQLPPIERLKEVRRQDAAGGNK